MLIRLEKKMELTLDSKLDALVPYARLKYWKFALLKMAIVSQMS